MKAKTARRRLRANEWKMARLKGWSMLRSYRGLGKKWKLWTAASLSETVKLPDSKHKNEGINIASMIRKMMAANLEQRRKEVRMK